MAILYIDLVASTAMVADNFIRAVNNHGEDILSRDVNNDIKA